MARIGIFGGTFDPIHLGHLIAAETVLSFCKLDRVIFVPCAVSPFKLAFRGGRGGSMVSGEFRRPLASAADRLAMIRLAIRGNSRLAVSDMELRRGGVSFTIDTLRSFRRRFVGGERLYFIIGADSLRSLHAWKEVERIVQLARVIVVSRPGAPVRVPRILERTVGVKAARAIVRDSVEMPLIGISSTQIRQRLARGEDVRYLVPEPVLDYIRRKNLYRNSESPGIAAKQTFNSGAGKQRKRATNGP